MNYEKHINDLIAGFQALKDQGEDISAAIVVSELDPDKNNTLVRDFAFHVLNINKSRFDAELKLLRSRANERAKTDKIAEQLGVCPDTPLDFVRAYVAKHGLTTTYQGVLKQPDDKSMSHFGELCTDLRNEAVVVGLGGKGGKFERGAINDAADMWFREAKIVRLEVYRKLIAFDPAKAADGLAALTRIAETCFSDDPRLIVAGLRKFIWQIKRKMNGIDVTNHLMIVLLGMQGAGKSTLAKKMIEVIAELSVSADFVAMADPKIISLWKSFAMLVDEMAQASKADINIVKNVITAGAIARRAMTTNTLAEVPNNLTFIGTSNATEFQEIIRDNTGTRRFLGINCKDKLDWETINATDWHTVWQSVDEQAEDPMHDVADLLQTVQETQRDKSRVEVWLDQLDVKDVIQRPKEGDRVDASKLYIHFRTFEENDFPGPAKTSSVSFGRHLSSARNSPFTRAGKNGVWIYTGASIGGNAGPPFRDNVTKMWG